MKIAMNEILSHTFVCAFSLFAGACLALHYTAKNGLRVHPESQNAGQNLASGTFHKNTSLAQNDSQQEKTTPTELKLRNLELKIMHTIQANHLKAIEDPAIFEAFLAQEKRAAVERSHAVFLRNQTLKPEQKKQFIDLLGQKSMYGVQAAYLANLSAQDSLTPEALLTMKTAKAEAEAEFSEKIAELLGEELNTRYLDFTQSGNLWKEMDKFALNMDPTATPLSDDQKIQIINLLKDSDVKNIVELGDKMKGILSSNQMTAYQSYAHEESLLALAKETRKSIHQKSDALRQELENSQK